MCRESNNTRHRLAISSDIAYSVWGIVYSSAHRFFQNLGTDERTAPHFRVFIILVQQRSRDERMEVVMNCNNVKLTNLGKSIVAKLSNYEFKDHALCINVEYVSVTDCLDRDKNILQYDCLEDCCRGSFKGAGKIRMPLDDCEDNGFMEYCADFSGTFEVKNYDRESRQFTTNISVNYQKR